MYCKFSPGELFRSTPFLVFPPLVRLHEQKLRFLLVLYEIAMDSVFIDRFLVNFRDVFSRDFQQSLKKCMTLGGF